MHTITCNKWLDKGEKLTTAKHTVVNVIQGFFQDFGQGGSKWDVMYYWGGGGKVILYSWKQSIWQTRGDRNNAPLCEAQSACVAY